MSDLDDAVASLPAVDQHAHVLAQPGQEPPLARLLTESDDPVQIDAARHHPAFHRAVADLAASGLEGDRRALLAACGFSAVLVDDGFQFPGAGTLDDLRRLVDYPVHRIVRVESLAESVAGGRFEDAVEAFRAGLRSALDAGAVALKTIAAYRGGLDLREVEWADAAAAYARWRGRLDDPVLVAFFLDQAIEVVRSDPDPVPVPVQVHTGMGDTDLRLAGADPARLEPFIVRCGAGVPIVLLHCHPYVAHASHLAGLYSHVYLDLSLAMTLASHLGPRLVVDALGQAPVSKLLFATDASRRAEGFYLGSRWWRASLGRALGGLVADGHITEPTAIEWAAMVLSGNARRLYSSLNGSA